MVSDQQFEEMRATAFAYYWARIEGDETVLAPADRTVPQCGFYRTTKGEPVGVDLNRDTGLPEVTIGYKPDWKFLADDIVAEWAETGALTRHPVRPEIYFAVARDGEVWPDVDPAVAQQIRADRDRGRNAPRDEAGLSDEEKRQRLYDQLKFDLDTLEAALPNYATITDVDHAKRALSLQERFSRLKVSAEKVKDELKRPHLDANKKIDGTWGRLVNTGEAAYKKVKSFIDAFETRRMRERAAEQARVDAEAVRVAERDATLATAAEPALPSPSAPPARQRSDAGYTLKETRVVKTITDFKALAEHFAHDKDVVDLLWRKAQKALDSGQDVPGITTEEVART